MEISSAAGNIKRLATVGDEGIQVIDEVDGIGEVVRPMSIRSIRRSRRAAETALSAFPDISPSATDDATGIAEPSTDL